MAPPGVDRIDGYRGPVEYEEQPRVVILLNIALLVLATEVLFPGVVVSFLSAIPFSFGEVREFVTGNLSQGVAVTAFVVALIVIHEAVHYAVHKVNGLSPTVGYKLVWFWKLPNPAPYVVVLDQPLTRRENVSGLIAPFVVINAVALIALLPVFPSTVSFFAGVALVLNTSGSSSDIYNAVKVSRFPPGTLFRNYETEGGIETYCYEPEDSEETVTDRPSTQPA